MLSHRWLLVAWLSGCGFTGPADTAGAHDAGRDAHGLDAPGQSNDAPGLDAPGPPVDAGPPACVTIAGLNVMLCPAAPPSGALHLTANTILDTMTGGSSPPGLMCATMMLGSTPDACALLATTIVIDPNVTLSVHGAKPLALLATVSIDVEGQIDVASHLAGMQGPASDLPGCSMANGPTGGGGGGGGTLGGAGGDGGRSAANPDQGFAGGVLAITTLRGGCPGVKGGGSNSAVGHGGGAVLVSTPMLTIGSGATINASGSSGSGANATTNGGSGGGSGGMIVLQASTISLAAGGHVFANGGAGGGGSSNAAGMPGTDPLSPTSGGTGGAGGGGGGGAGGSGFPAGQRTGQAGNSNSNGGGGGGGGAGVIKAISSSAITGSNVSPPPS